jgi:ectoine hydroxylase-related dioxygenase (phytanoyl-CoA dioxygenase family)
LGYEQEISGKECACGRVKHNKTMLPYQNDLYNNGFAIIENVYNKHELSAITSVIDNADQSNATFRKTEDLFAIRQFLKEMPEVKPLIINNKLKALISSFLDDNYFIVKSIYFDKPEKSNWFVAWHQDLTIAVDRKTEILGYGPWTTKLNKFAVQPPVNLLQDNFTIRIHLDDTDKGNGALKVIPGSHLKNIYRVGNIDWQTESETYCNVKAGGIMIMRPLLMHASNRTITNKRRRVIHIEFSKTDLPQGINWAEKELY